MKSVAESLNAQLARLETYKARLSDRGFESIERGDTDEAVRLLSELWLISRLMTRINALRRKTTERN